LVRVALRLSEADVERIARRTVELLGGESAAQKHAASPFLTVPETAAYLRCKRQRVDDLLSQGALTRVKEGARTLVARAELETYLRGEPTGRLGSRRAA
jgi:excisionase family DNA binding protein